MKRFMLLHYGFEKPTPEIMTAWKEWFESVAEKSVDNGGFHGAAREISDTGSKDLFERQKDIDYLDIPSFLRTQAD